MRAPLILAATVLLLAAGCGASGSATTAAPATVSHTLTSKTRLPGLYPHAAEVTFVRGCLSGASGHLDYCTCSLAQIEQTVPYARYKAFDSAFRRKKPVPAATQRAILQAINACRAQS